MLRLKAHLDPCGIAVQLTIVIAKPPSSTQNRGKRPWRKLKADLFRRHSVKIHWGSGSAVSEVTSHYQSDKQIENLLPTHNDFAGRFLIRIGNKHKILINTRFVNKRDATICACLKARLQLLKPCNR